jgi:hypothetical protein
MSASIAIGPSEALSASKSRIMNSHWFVSVFLEKLRIDFSFFAKKHSEFSNGSHSKVERGFGRPF